MTWPYRVNVLDLEPRGPLSPEIYWRRRGLAIGIAVVVVAIVVAIIVAVLSGGAGANTSGTAKKPAAQGQQNPGPEVKTQVEPPAGQNTDQPAETPTAGLVPGSVSGRFAVTAAAIDPASGAATSQVAATLVVKDAPNSFTSDAASDSFVFRQGFATTDIYQFAATGPNHDFIGLDQALFPNQTIQQVLDSNALHPGTAAGDVDIAPASGNVIHLHDGTGQLTVDLLRANPGDFFFV